MHDHAGRNRPPVPAEVVGFRDGRTLLMPLGEMTGIGPGTAVTATGGRFACRSATGCSGRVLDGLGRPIDGGRPLRSSDCGAAAGVPPPIRWPRQRIDRRAAAGRARARHTRAVGRGQRLGIFAGSGVGKSRCWA